MNSSSPRSKSKAARALLGRVTKSKSPKSGLRPSSSKALDNRRSSFQPPSGSRPISPLSRHGSADDKQWGFRGENKWASMSTSQLMRPRAERKKSLTLEKSGLRRSKSEPTLNSWDYLDDDILAVTTPTKKKKKKRKKKKKSKGNSQQSGSDKDHQSPRNFGSSCDSDIPDHAVVARSSTKTGNKYTSLQLNEMRARHEKALTASRAYYSQLPPPSSQSYKALMAVHPLMPRHRTRDTVPESPRGQPVSASFGEAEMEQEVCDIDDDEEAHHVKPKLKPSTAQRLSGQYSDTDTEAAILRRSISLSHMLEASIRAKNPIESELEDLEQKLEELVVFEKGETDASRKLIASASVLSLTESLLAAQDTFFIHEFLSTHLYFIPSFTLLRNICNRYTASMASMQDDNRLCLRIINVLRKWIEFYCASFTDEDICYLKNFIDVHVVPVQGQWGKLLQSLLARQLQELERDNVAVGLRDGYQGCLQHEQLGNRVPMDLLCDYVVNKGGKKRQYIVSLDEALARIQRALSVSEEIALEVHEHRLVKENFLGLVTERDVEAWNVIKEEKEAKEAEGKKPTYYQYLGPRMYRPGEEYPKPLISKKLQARKPVDFMDIHPVELARQLTLFEQDLFSAIVPHKHLVNVSQKKQPEVKRFIDWSNRLANWAASEIVQTGNMKKRMAVLKRLIMVADECWKINNFSSAVSLIQGIGNPSVKRLKHTWKRLPRSQAKLEEDYVESISVLHNFEKLRLAIANATPPLIPYFALFLRDISLIEINNDDYTKPGVVNFSKFRMISLQFQEIQALQQQRYQLVRSSGITRWLFTGLVNLSPDKLEEYSRDCENPQDAIDFGDGGERMAAYSALRSALKRKQ